MVNKLVIRKFTPAVRFVEAAADALTVKQGVEHVSV